MEILFTLIGINITNYYYDLYKLLKTTIENNIILYDVEFILVSIKTDQGYKNGVYMIDYDKTNEKIINETNIEVLINQDMFPEYVRLLLTALLF